MGAADDRHDVGEISLGQSGDPGAVDDRRRHAGEADDAGLGPLEALKEFAGDETFRLVVPDVDAESLGNQVGRDIAQVGRLSVTQHMDMAERVGRPHQNDINDVGIFRNIIHSIHPPLFRRSH